MFSRLYEIYGMMVFVVAGMAMLILFLMIIIKNERGRNKLLEQRCADLEKDNKNKDEINGRLKKNIEEEFNRRKEELRAQENKHNRELTELKQKDADEWTSLKMGYDADLDHLKNRIHEMEMQHDEKLQGIVEQHEQRITTLSRQYAREVASLKENYNRENKELVESVAEKEVIIKTLQDELEKRNDSFKTIMESNLEAIPYLSGVMADFLTYDLEVLANQLDWGKNKKRKETEIKIREIRKNTEERIDAAKNAEYQLAYLKELYPEIEDIIETDYRELSIKHLSEDTDRTTEDSDETRKYLTREEWTSLSESDRNQRALDNYVERRRKSKWQIGRDYELYIGYSLYESCGWDVRYFGSEKRLEDLGRDLIAKKGFVTEIVQCKYWSEKKLIHEKHIFQLYGTKVCYELEHKDEEGVVNAKFITNTSLSPKAQEIADILGVLVEYREMGEFPRIKCNINRDERGKETKIYHLPMDQQYDNVIIDKEKGEMLAYTVEEAEKAGFRRAYKWHEKDSNDRR